MADPQKNKETVLAYYNMAFNDKKPAEAAEKYGGPYYIQHNPQAPDGFEAFIQFVTNFVEQFPQRSLDIKRAIADGDIVATHSLLKTSPEDRGTAAADFFRLGSRSISWRQQAASAPMMPTCCAAMRRPPSAVCRIRT